jgi:hypothetical protein
MAARRRPCRWSALARSPPTERGAATKGGDRARRIGAATIASAAGTPPSPLEPPCSTRMRASRASRQRARLPGQVLECRLGRGRCSRREECAEAVTDRSSDHIRRFKDLSPVARVRP